MSKYNSSGFIRFLPWWPDSCSTSLKCFLCVESEMKHNSRTAQILSLILSWGVTSKSCQNINIGWRHCITSELKSGIRICYFHLQFIILLNTDVVKFDTIFNFESNILYTVSMFHLMFTKFYKRKHNETFFDICITKRWLWCFQRLSHYRKGDHRLIGILGLVASWKHSFYLQW